MDDAELTDAQASSLALFLEATHTEDASRAIQVLSVCDWDVQRAMELLLLDSDTNPHLSAALPPRSSPAETTAASSASQAAPEASSAASPASQAPSSNASPASALGSVGGFLSALPGASLVGSALGLLGRSVASVMPTSVTEIVTGPTTSDAGLFSAAFAENFGPDCPPWFVGTPQEAVAHCRTVNRLLFLYLHSGHHEQTSAFCRETLCSPLVRDFLASNFVCWGGDVSKRDGYRLASTLRATVYPCCALLAFNPQNPTQHALLCKIQGAPNPEQLVTQLAQVLERYQGARRQTQARSLEADAARLLREQQEREYEEALEADRRRQEQAREAERAEQEEQERLRREEEERQRAIELELSRKRRLLESVAPEPDRADPEAVVLQLRLPDGSQKQRVFRSSDAWREVFKFIEGHELTDPDGKTIERFRVLSNYPRRAFTDADETIGAAGLGRGAALFVKEALDGATSSSGFL